MLRLALILSLMGSAAYADTVYKSVDDEGNIVYSAEPSAEGQKVKALKSPPEVSDEDKEAAAERQRRLQTYLDESAGSDRKAAQTDGDTRREAARRRAIWGKDWPIHEPLNR